MKQNILVLVGSPRKEGNTMRLVKAFAKGASDNANVEIVNVSDYNIAPCKACEYCHQGERPVCCQKDDMQLLYDKMNRADVLVLASPIYFFGMSAQLKTVIDRLHNPIRKEFPIKKLGMIAVAGSSKPFMFDTVKRQFEIACSYLGFESIGMVTAGGMRELGDVDGTEFLQQAEAMGKGV